MGASPIHVAPGVSAMGRPAPSLNSVTVAAVALAHRPLTSLPLDRIHASPAPVTSAVGTGNPAGSREEVFVYFTYWITTLVKPSWAPPSTVCWVPLVVRRHTDAAASHAHSPRVW